MDIVVLGIGSVGMGTAAWLQRDGHSITFVAPVPLEPQRGYHVTVQSSNLALCHTVMAPKYHLKVNPMAMGLRLAGSVEFARLRRLPHGRRADVPRAKGRELSPDRGARA